MFRKNVSVRVKKKKKKGHFFGSGMLPDLKHVLEYYICSLQFVIILILFLVIKLCLNLLITARVWG